jgi:quinol monooxygenase YgiN
MSVIIAAKLAGDTAAFTKSLEDRADEYRKIGERSREKGALHHRFGIGDGFIFINDEWESAEAFEKFFGDPELQKFIGSVGGDTNAAPEIIIVESVDSPEMF